MLRWNRNNSTENSTNEFVVTKIFTEELQN